MATHLPSPIKTYTAGEAIGAYVRVKKSSGNVVAAGAGEVGIGVTAANVENGGLVPVMLWNGYGTAFMKAGGAITLNAAVYPIANGKIDDAQSTQGAPLGYAEEAATADGDVIEVLLRGYQAGEPIAHADQAAVVTTGASNSTPYGFTTAAQANAIVSLVNAMRSALIAHGLIKGAA